MIDENNKNVEKIKELESKVKTLEEVKEMFDSQPRIARTTSGGLLLFCNECMFAIIVMRLLRRKTMS